MWKEELDIFQMFTQILQVAEPLSAAARSLPTFEVVHCDISYSVSVSLVLEFLDLCETCRSCWGGSLGGIRSAWSTSWSNHLPEAFALVKEGFHCLQIQELSFTRAAEESWPLHHPKTVAPYAGLKRVGPDIPTMGSATKGHLLFNPRVRIFRAATEDMQRMVLPLPMMESVSVLPQVPQGICTSEGCGLPSTTFCLLAVMVDNFWWAKI